MHYLSFDLSDNDEGVTTLEALASTPAAQHAAVMAEVQQVLDWAWREFPRPTTAWTGTTTCRCRWSRATMAAYGTA